MWFIKWISKKHVTTCNYILEITVPLTELTTTYNTALDILPVSP